MLKPAFEKDTGYLNIVYFVRSDERTSAAVQFTEQMQLLL